MKMRCEHCGKDKEIPRAGVLVQNRFRRAVGVVLGEGPRHPTHWSKPILRVMVVTGAQRGTEMRWYAQNVDEVHGLLHVTRRV